MQRHSSVKNKCTLFEPALLLNRLRESSSGTQEIKALG